MGTRSATTRRPRPRRTWRVTRIGPGRWERTRTTCNRVTCRQGGLRRGGALLACSVDGRRREGRGWRGVVGDGSQDRLDVVGGGGGVFGADEGDESADAWGGEAVLACNPTSQARGGTPTRAVRADRSRGPPMLCHPSSSPLLIGSMSERRVGRRRRVMPTSNARSPCPARLRGPKSHNRCSA